MSEEAAQENPTARKLGISSHRRLQDFARGLYPGGTDAYSFDEAQTLRTTRELLDNGISPIYSAQLATDEFKAKFNLLVRHPSGGLEIVLIKGAKTVKPDYISAAVYQCMVAQECGYDVEAVTVVHISSDLAWDGEPHRPETFFTRSNITDQTLAKASEIRDRARALSTLKTITLYPEPSGLWPHVDPGLSKDCPDCNFFNHCRAKHPDDLLAFSFLGGRTSKSLLEQGFTRLSELPEDLELEGRDAELFFSYQLGQPIRGANLDAALAKIEFPAFLVDFEAFQPVIPLIPGTKSYQAIPFQWSCHRLESPPVPSSPANVDEGHFEFLWSESSDPRPAFVESLLECLGTRGSFLHWHNFEIRLLKELAQDGIPHADELLQRVTASNVDLNTVLSKNYFDARMSSTSIKDVLKAVTDDIRYADLAVGNGTMAMQIYERMYRGEITEEQRQRDLADLLEYCKLDTWAMVLTLRAMLPK